MSTIEDYSVDEWRAISAAPTAVALALTMTADDTNPQRDNTTAVRDAIARPPDAPDIIKALVDGLETRPHLDALRHTAGSDRANATESWLATVRAAVRAIEDKSPAEAEAFKAWLAWVGTKACHAGSGHVDQQAVDQLSEILRVALPQGRSPRAECSVGDKNQPGAVFNIARRPAAAVRTRA